MRRRSYGYYQGTFDADLDDDDRQIDFEAIRGWHDDDSSDEGDIPFVPETEDDPGTQREIGNIVYGEGQSATLTIPLGDHVKYPVRIHPQQQVHGVHVPSHRALFGYVAISQIPTTPTHGLQLHHEYTNLVRQLQHLQPQQRLAATPSEILKRSLISLATFGFGNKAVRANKSLAQILEGFQEILRKVLPPSLQFRRLLITVPEVNLVTGTGTFALEAVSGGITAIIDLAWQIYTYTLEHPKCVVTIDEPENHLHPELQRNLLPTFLDAFQDAQFIIASHNPFIVSSVARAHVYALGYNKKKRIVSHRLDTQSLVGSTNEILRDVLGLQASWAKMGRIRTGANSRQI